MSPDELEEVRRKAREQYHQRRRDQEQQQQYLNQLHGHRERMSDEDITRIRQQHAAQHQAQQQTMDASVAE
eukprot:7875316-Ditylum_brightwellii.AAC.1